MCSGSPSKAIKMEKNFDVIGNDFIRLYISKTINFDFEDQERMLVLYDCIGQIFNILSRYTDKQVEVITFAFTVDEP